MNIEPITTLKLKDDGLWINLELNGKHVAINLDHVRPAEFFCAEFRAKYAVTPVVLKLGDDRTIARLAAEKAPKGATHCGPAEKQLSPIFLRKVDGLVTDVWTAGRGWSLTSHHYTFTADDQPSIYHRLIPLPCDGNHGGPRCADPECWIDDVVDAAFDAPIEAVPGLLDCSCLPPVGVFCEMQDAQGAWIKVEIFANHAGFAHGWDAGYKRSYFSDLPKEFRPLRTTEQIAADERPSPALSGEGLPPVGAVCEVVDDGSLVYGHGESGSVVAHVENCAVVRMSYGLGCFTASCLRPVRTPEQIAAEEREAAVSAMWTQLNLRLPERHRIFDGKYRDALFSVLATLHKVGFKLPGGAQ